MLKKPHSTCTWPCQLIPPLATGLLAWQPISPPSFPDFPWFLDFSSSGVSQHHNASSSQLEWGCYSHVWEGQRHRFGTEKNCQGWPLGLGRGLELKQGWGSCEDLMTLLCCCLRYLQWNFSVVFSPLSPIMHTENNLHHVIIKKIHKLEPNYKSN